ncbi:MAG: hypothetical protein RIR97_2086, partial [Pseudomonadota bacterium]
MFRIFANTTLKMGLSLSVCFCAVENALAQTVPSETGQSAGQLVPPTFAAPVEKPKTGFAFGGDMRTLAPKGAEKAELLVGGIEVDGLDPKFREKVDSLISPFKGQKRPASDIYALAGDIQKLYADDGYFLNRVVIPPQDVGHGGVVKLKVLEGFIAEIRLESLVPEVRSRVARYFGPLQDRKGLKQAEFERALLLAAGTSGLKLKSNISPSEQLLGVTLTLSGDYDPVSAQMSTDNSLSEAMGIYQTSLSASLNSPFHIGDMIYFNVSGAPSNEFLGPKSPRRVFAAGLTVPLSDNGLSGNLEYTWSGTQPLTFGRSFATKSEFQRATAKLSYPFILNQVTSLTGRVQFDDIDEINSARAFRYTLYHDHLNVIRGGLDYSTFLGGVQISSGFEASQGISGLGSRGPAEAKKGPGISQQYASDRFSKIMGNVRVHQDYASGFGWDLTARGQYSPTGALMNSEKFVVGCSCDLSGVDSGSWSGDHGWAVRAELQYDLSHAVNIAGLSLKPYIFGARGQVYAARPTASELAMDG